MKNLHELKLFILIFSTRLARHKLIVAMTKKNSGGVLFSYGNVKKLSFIGREKKNVIDNTVGIDFCSQPFTDYYAKTENVKW